MNNSSITLLDGAMGTELRARGVQIRDYYSSLWSALACVEAPKAVMDLHLDYVRAGADVITVSNYAITPVLLAREGRSHELEPLIEAAALCAVRARDAAHRMVQIAGSLPPLNTSYAAHLVDGFPANLANYRRITAELAPHVDLLLCETLSTAQEARAAATAAQETGKPYWVSWTVDRNGSRLRSGENFDVAINRLADLSPAALLVNCSSTRAVSTALCHLRELTDLPLGAYANPIGDEPQGGEPLRVIDNPLTANQYTAIARDWITTGASIIGGCCDTNPAYIAALSRMIAAHERQPSSPGR